MMLRLIIFAACAVAGISAECAEGYTEVETQTCVQVGRNNKTEEMDRTPTICPTGYVLNANPRLCFRVSPPNERKNFNDAERYCERLRNGRLLVLNAEDKYGFIAGLMSVLGPTGLKLGSFDDGLWVGLKRVSLTLFRWKTGSPYVPNWGVAQPEKVIGEDCGQIYPGGIRNQLCNLYRRYICEIPVTTQ
ncbi:snaclec coagulation factor IX/factor X-binding protein subunit A-like [Haliotis asinina]|uniref:snaclec coagulation factor IX/factor X-binding protein subunit A-like n=1 Tax=Haliotis asinina TaxID=109174 RepID=UPI003531E237